MGLVVLFTFIGFCQTGWARVAHQIRSDEAQVLEKADSPVKQTKISINSSSIRKEVYLVQKGDSLARIANKTGISVSDLRSLNHLSGTRLKIGQKLILHLRPGQDIVPASSRNWQAGADLEDEEEDGAILSEQAWIDIEKRTKTREALLGNWNNPDEPKLLVKVAMGFLGAPYRLGGASVTGIDCSAFVKKIYQFFNISLPRTAYEQSHVGLRVSRGELVEGDLLFFNTRRKLGHVGIYIGNNEFVHASSRKRGVRVDSLSTPYFDRRFVRAVRLKGIDDGL